MVMMTNPDPLAAWLDRYWQGMNHPVREPSELPLRRCFCIDCCCVRELRALFTTARREAAEQKPIDFVALLALAEVRVRSSVLYGQFIDGTPLEHDIACWMANFAAEQLTIALDAEQED